jgi:hypothetical protein
VVAGKRKHESVHEFCADSETAAENWAEVLLGVTGAGIDADADRSSICIDLHLHRSADSPDRDVDEATSPSASTDQELWEGCASQLRPKIALARSDLPPVYCPPTMAQQLSEEAYIGAVACLISESGEPMREAPAYLTANDCHVLRTALLSARQLDVPPPTLGVEPPGRLRGLMHFPP